MHFPRQKGERMGIDVKTHGDDLFSGAAYDDSPARARSEAQERSSVLIAGRALSVCGDAQVRPGGEKSVVPLPKRSSQVKTRKIVSWITPRRVGERPDVASIAEERAKRLKDWMSARGIYPAVAPTALSGGAYCEFGDFANLMKLIAHVWLGGGAKARKLLGVRGTPTGVTAEVEIDSATLSFQDIALERNMN